MARGRIGLWEALRRRGGVYDCLHSEQDYWILAKTQSVRERFAWAVAL